MSAPHENRLLEIDALRGIAALGVLIFHFTGEYGRLYGHTENFTGGFTIGMYGVQLFFVLSGFVIFMTLQRTRRALDFVVSRFSRLFPAYWTAMAVTMLVVGFAGLVGQRVSTRDAWINLSMLSDLLEARTVDDSYWTLQIELLFYVQMLCWFVAGALKRIRLIIFGWLMLAAAYGIAARSGHHFSYLLRELLVVRYIPLFAVGILMYHLRETRNPARQDSLLLVACIASAWLVWDWRIALATSICAAVFALLIGGYLGFLRRPSLLFFGGISYTLYLVHQNIGYIAIAALERIGVSPLLSIVAASMATVLLAWLLSTLVERPALKWIRGAFVRRRLLQVAG